MNVAILGAGNVATVLSALIRKAGHKIVQVVSRNAINAQELADKCHTKSGLLSDDNFAEADLYIIALTDDAIGKIGQYKSLQNKFLVHTAGSVSMDVLKNITSSYGVMYPLQTLSKNANEIPYIPFLVGANNSENIDILMNFAGSLSDDVSFTTDEERLKYHVAAVFVGNFTNHLLAMGEVFCEKERLNYQTLIPLINQVTHNAIHESAFKMQTGPAIREDIVTLNKHLQALSAHTEWKYIYLKLSESILKIHQKTK